MFSLYWLVLKTNIKSPTIAFPILMPLLFLLIFAPNLTSDQAVNTAVISIMAIITLQSGVMSFGINFMNLKKSVLLKRIGATRITKPRALMSVALYGITLWFISVVWLFFLTALMSYFNFFGAGSERYSFQWDQVNWALLIIAVAFGLVLSYSIGFMFLSITKTDQQYSLLALFYFFLAIFLGGMFFPNVVNEIDWMVKVGYFIPSVYNAHMFTAAANGVTVLEAFNFIDGYTYETISPSTGSVVTITVYGWKAALDFFMPIVFTILAWLVALKFFKWDNA